MTSSILRGMDIATALALGQRSDGRPASLVGANRWRAERARTDRLFRPCARQHDAASASTRPRSVVSTCYGRTADCDCVGQLD